MLYKLDKKDDKFASLDPLPFQGLPLEKELEDLLAQNLFDVLFEESNLMPIFQERAWQEEADIYALNRAGDLVIFELKRDGAGAGRFTRPCAIARRRAASTTRNCNAS